MSGCGLRHRDGHADACHGAPATLRLRLAASTDVGRRRPHNEDALLVADLVCAERDQEAASHDHLFPPCVMVLGVFDGMGGAAAGELASALAADEVFSALKQGGRPSSADELSQRLAASLDRASTAVHEASLRDVRRQGMGTTATLAGLWGKEVQLAQVGDSRAYLLRQGRLTQLTRDQSLVAYLVERGLMSPDEARISAHRNVILQAVGVRRHVDVERTRLEIAAGDVLLLCSDGLCAELSDDDIADTLTEASSPSEACRALIARANAAGGSDNITCLVAMFDMAR